MCAHNWRINEEKPYGANDEFEISTHAINSMVWRGLSYFGSDAFYGDNRSFRTVVRVT
ncbi:hypothetical protein GCM10011410_08980 [Hoyosella rhizosphaerae]|uniref:Uncharacterized protein n=1 Tax=Hoyosella rhizosphaerae TaxID=1755582 RepID=A0A916U331_9ACTN|nr:hypothetical protein GCM10011410_08980 [Hoyosella rhizosphaerae]